MESTGRARIRECQIEQERRYERARQDLEDEQRRTEYEIRYHTIKKHYPIHTDTTGMKRVRKIK